VNKKHDNVTTCDVVVVGGGFCGSIVGIKAHDLGLNVKVLEAKAHYPDNFRAEKLENDQIEALASMDLLGLVQPTESPPIDRVHTFTGDVETVSEHQNHRGLHYQDTVNALRNVLIDRGLLIVQRASDIRDGPDFSQVLLNDEATLRARLVVVATGMEPTLRKSLNLVSRANDKLFSTTFGFDVKPASDTDFRVRAFNARPHAFESGLQYATFFPVGNRTRANLFTCWEQSNERVRKLKSATSEELRNLFPSLDSHVGPLRVSSKVDTYSTRYYRLEADHLARTVLAGDAFQSVNPANGVGLSKCLTDTQTLLALLPELSRTASSSVDLAAYYRDPRKCEVDYKALKRWRWSNELATSQSVQTKMKKLQFATTARVKAFLT
jgi:2-polyprenyl-6-methoxyphenol hydroxylase-like FAD-dependent oxidoreductase